MDKKRIAREKRKRQAQERIGTLKPQCSICAETNPHCFEKHHVAQRKYDDTLVTLCKNCHAKASDLQKDHPWPLDGEPTKHERFGRMLLGLADLLRLVVEKLTEIGEWLINEAKHLAEKQNSQPPQEQL